MKRFFTPLWHPPESNYAGGFYRARRLLEEMTEFEFCAVDSETTSLTGPPKRGTLTLYHTKRIVTASPKYFKAFRAVNWSVSCLLLTIAGLRFRDLSGVYVPTSEVLPVTLAGAIVARVRNVPLVLCNLNIRGTAFWNINRMLHRSARGIITISAALRDELREQLPHARLEIGSVGVDDFSVPRGEPRFDAVFVGRQTRDKGVFDLVDVWSRLRERGETATLALAGPIQPQVRVELESTIAKLGLGEQITILGAVTENEKWELLSRSRICVFASAIEGWGIVPIEAHLAGLPVVAYDLPAYAETIAQSPFALLSECGDIDAFTRNVSAALSREWPSSEIRTWAAKFSWPSVVSLEERLIEAIVTDTPVAPVAV
jgi:glycosyltransferase involved in cell wall biosynthesis